MKFSQSSIYALIMQLIPYLVNVETIDGFHIYLEMVHKYQSTYGLSLIKV